MIEQQPELEGPFHLIRCFGQLAMMYVAEVKTGVLNAFEDSLNCWGDDE